MCLFPRKVPFPASEVSQAPGLVYNLERGVESTKNASLTDATFSSDHFIIHLTTLPFCQQKGPHISSHFQKECITPESLRSSVLACPCAREGSVTVTATARLTDQRPRGENGKKTRNTRKSKSLPKASRGKHKEAKM